jgi:hypothetical protein
MIIGDLTRAYGNTLPRLMYAFGQRLRVTRSPGIVVCHAHQATAITLPPEAKVVTLEGVVSPSEIVGRIRDTIILPILTNDKPSRTGKRGRVSTFDIC